MFYISSRGHSATLWLSVALSNHPNIVCWHGTRSIPPYDSGVNDLSEEEFVKGLLRCEQPTNGVKKFGACHGFYGTRLLKYVNKYNGTFLAIVRNPITKIHSYISEYLETTPANEKFIIYYKFDIIEFYKEYCEKINSNFNRIINLKKERERKKKLAFKNLKNLKLFYPIRKIYRFIKTKEKIYTSSYKKISINKLIKSYGSNFIIEKVILSFIRNCESTLNSDEKIYKKIGFRDFICMEKMTESSSYFDNKVFKKIMNKNAEKNYLSKVFKIKNLNKHTFRPISATNIYNCWPKAFKNYFSEIYEKNKAKKMYAMMNYKIEKII